MADPDPAQAERSRKEWIAYYLRFGDVDSARKLGLEHDNAVAHMQIVVRYFLKARSRVARWSGPELLVTVVEALGLPRRVFGPSSFVAEVGGGMRPVSTAAVETGRAQWLQSLRVGCHSYYGYGGAQREPGPPPSAPGVQWSTDGAGATELLRVRVVDTARRGNGDTLIGCCYIAIGDAIDAGRAAAERARDDVDEGGAIPPLGTWHLLWLPRGRRPVGYVRLLVTSPDTHHFNPVTSSPSVRRGLPSDFEAERQSKGIAPRRTAPLDAPSRDAAAAAASVESAAGVLVSVLAAKGLPLRTQIFATVTLGRAHARTRTLALDVDAEARSSFAVPATAGASGKRVFLAGECLSVRVFDAAETGTHAEKELGCCVVPLPRVRGSAGFEAKGWFGLSPPTASPAAATAEGEAVRLETVGAVFLHLRALGDSDNLEPLGGTLTIDGVTVAASAIARVAGAASSDGAEIPAELAASVITPRLLYAFYAAKPPARKASSPAPQGAGAVLARELTEFSRIPPAMAAAAAAILARRVQAQAGEEARAAADAAAAVEAAHKRGGEPTGGKLKGDEASRPPVGSEVAAGAKLAKAKAGSKSTTSKSTPDGKLKKGTTKVRQSLSFFG